MIASTSSRRRSWMGGLAISALGAVLVAFGLVQTTASNPNLSCPSGLDLIAKFNVVEGRYVFEKPSGNQNIVITSNGSGAGADMRSTTPISAIIVKGGPSAVVVTFSTPQTTAHFSNSGLPEVGAGNIPDISNVQFCGGTRPPAATITAIVQDTTASGTGAAVTEPSPPATEPETTDTTQVASTTTTRPETSTTRPQAVTTTTAVAQEVQVVTSTSVVTGLPVDGTPLPRTGSNSVPLIAVGLVLLAVGVTLIAVGRASERRERR